MRILPIFLLLMTPLLVITLVRRPADKRWSYVPFGLTVLTMVAVSLLVLLGVIH